MLLCFSSFYWSVLGLFKKGSNQRSLRYRFYQLITAGVWISCLYGVWEQDYQQPVQLIAPVGQVMALGLFFWASRTIKARPFTIVFSDDLPDELVQSGPYKWIRHPFYMAYLLSYVSGLFWSMGVISSFFVFVCVGLIFQAIYSEEKKFSKSNLSDSYKNYRKQTAMLIPRPSEIFKKTG